jgi:hypothetical protein
MAFSSVVKGSNTASTVSKADRKAALDVGAWLFNVTTSVGIIMVNKQLMANYGFRFGTTLSLSFLTVFFFSPFEEMDGFSCCYLHYVVPPPFFLLQ